MFAFNVQNTTKHNSCHSQTSVYTFVGLCIKVTLKGESLSLPG